MTRSRSGSAQTSGDWMVLPLMATRPAAIHCRASVRDPNPALERIRSRVLPCFSRNSYDRTAMIECVPNFSEGREAAVIGAIVEAMASAPGVLLLGSESDSDHNRSVVTFAGDPEAVTQGAIRGAGKAAELIDLGGHKGVHPR